MAARTAELRATNDRLVAEMRERVEATEALDASERRFRAIFDNAFQFTGLLSPEGELVEANQTALDFIGVTLDEVRGRPFWETPWWAHDAAARQALRVALAGAATGRIQRFEATHRGRDGGLIDIDVSLKPLLGEDGDVVGVIAEGRDITARRASEERRRSLEAQLAQAQKLDSIGRLAGGIAHDINNYLTVILGNTDALRFVYFADREPDELADIREAGGSAASLTHQLLAFSRKQVVEPRELSLNALVEQLQRMLTRLLGDDVALVAALAPDLPPVVADPGQLQQVLVNLAVNARDAMPRGGTLTVETRSARLDADRVAGHPGLEPGVWVELAIRDTGSGIAADVVPHLFEPFFTTKPEGEGTGLGLAIVHGIVHQSGGFIEVASEVGRGSTFSVFLPAALAAGRPERAAEALRSPGGDEVVLVVDDRAEVHRVVARSLVALGYRVLECGDGATALRAARTLASELALLITDVVMPRMDGTELARQMRPLHPSLRVLYISGSTADVMAARGLAELDHPLLSKPFSAAELAAKVREVLDAPVADGG